MRTYRDLMGKILGMLGTAWFIALAGLMANGATASAAPLKIVFILDRSPGYDEILATARGRLGYPLEMKIVKQLHLYQDTTVEAVKAQYRRTILDRVRQLGIDKDMEVDLAKISDFEQFLQELHLKIHAIEDQRVPYGLHTFGVLPDKPHLMAMIKEMLGAAYPQKVTKLLVAKMAGLSSIKKEELVEATAIPG
jgi:hypothetical protein